MNNKLEYLIKYSVGSPPSRDYYSLKVLQDEIILHLWRISHGPHKAPIIHRVKFAEFSQEKSLQDKIRNGFGEHLLTYVKNITKGNLNTLLTLPKSLIGEIIRYLKFTDIVKLSSLSHVAYEIFNADSVWQILYERDKKPRVSLEERQAAKVYGWKHLYKDKQIQMSLKNKKTLRIQSSLKFANDSKINKSSLKLTSGALKAVSKTVSTSNIAKKHSESPNMDPITIPLSKATSDTRFRANAKNEKLLPKKRNVKNAPEFNTSEKNVKREDLIASKMTTKRENTKSTLKCDEGVDKQHDKLEKHKRNNINARLQESKSKPPALKTQSLSKNTIKSIRSSSNLAQNSHSKTRSKTKTKPEKVAATKCEIFNTAEELSNNKSFIVRHDDLDLTNLIEASLKNIRSPRSIFDYDFSYTQQSNATKNASGTYNKILNIDKLQQLKPTRSDFITNDFSDRLTRGGTLEKLSEKSESFSESESSESLMRNEKHSSKKDNKTVLLSEKYMKAREDLRKSLNWSRSNSTFSETR